MTATVHAIYENGVFRPTEKVDLPDLCEVEVEIRQVNDGPKKPTLDDVYAILGKRHASGEHDVAERHNEHVAAEPKRDISEILSDPNVVVEALREAVQDEVKRHKQMGLPMAIWRDGKVVWVPAEELEEAKEEEQ
ncbi:MAG: antitoxin family protein [Thermoguttaceae bacterium]|jgi:predicted DNA-binding antitoxin AbrB/MazE fold protein